MENINAVLIADGLSQSDKTSQVKSNRHFTNESLKRNGKEKIIKIIPFRNFCMFVVAIVA